MNSKYQVALHRRTQNPYMVKKLGGMNNIVSIKKQETHTIGAWTYYTVTLKDPSLIQQWSKFHMRVKQL